VRGTLHWVSIPHAVSAEVRHFDNLFLKSNPEEVETGQDFLDNINPDSVEILNKCKVEPSLLEAKPGQYFQFLRHGYYCADSQLSKPDQPVFNRSVSLRDTWAKSQRK